MKKVAHATEESGALVGEVFGQTGETDAARFQMNEEQDVIGGEASPGESLQVVFWLRLGAGWIPYRRRMLPTV
jgi:hypothetical protein